MRRGRRGGEQNGRGAQEEVVRDPELVEPCFLSRYGQVDEGRHSDVVVDPEAGPKRRPACHVGHGAAAVRTALTALIGCG